MLVYIQHPKFKIIQVQIKRSHYLNLNTKPFSTSVRLFKHDNRTKPDVDREISDNEQQEWEIEEIEPVEEAEYAIPPYAYHIHYGFDPNEEFGRARIWHQEENLRSVGPELIPPLEERTETIRNDIEDIRGYHPELRDRDQYISNAENELTAINSRLTELRNQENADETNDRHENDNHRNNDGNGNGNGSGNNLISGNNDNDNHNDNDNGNGNGNGNDSKDNGNGNSNGDSYDNNTNFTLDLSFLDISFYHEILYLPTCVKYIILAYSTYKLIINTGLYHNLYIKFIILCNAINNIPKNYIGSTFLLKSQLLSLPLDYNGVFNRLSMFNVMSKKDTLQKKRTKPKQDKKRQ